MFLAYAEDRDTMMNLLEKYLYEFSQWEKTDVNDNGLYGYEYLDCYFEENTCRRLVYRNIFEEEKCHLQWWICLQIIR